MPIAATRSQLKRLLGGARFNQFFRFRIQSAGRGTCCLRVPFRAVFERPGGIVGGQVFMAAADAAMWLAVATRLGTAEQAVTVEMKTNFLSAGRKEGFLCHAQILKLGRRLIYGVAECVNARGTLLTHHTLTYIRAGAAAEKDRN